MFRWIYRKLKQKRTERKIQNKRPDISGEYSELKEVKSLSGQFSQFEKLLYHNPSTIGLIIGARGTGKSALGLRILENFKHKSHKKLQAWGFKEEDLPHWIENINSLEQIKNDAVVLIDESGIEFSSRNSLKTVNKILSELLLISRHKDLSVIFIAQNSSNIELNVIRQADYLLLKPSSLLQKNFERQKISDIYQEVTAEFEKLKEHKGLTYVYGPSYRGFVTNTLPSFWSESVSKSYRGKKSETSKKEVNKK